MALTKFPVTLFYDVLSPYSYIGFTILNRYKQIWSNMDLQLKPCSIKHIFTETGNVAPGTNATKASHLVRDLSLISKMAQIPFVLPSNFADLAFNQGSIKALKFLIAADIHTESKATESLSRQIFRRIFTNEPGKEIQTQESWLEAGQAAGIDETVLKEIISQVESEPTKTRLRLNTNEAINAGAFGLPWIIVHSPEGQTKLFGSDRIELLAHLIGEKYLGPNPLESQSN